MECRMAKVSNGYGEVTAAPATSDTENKKSEIKAKARPRVKLLVGEPWGADDDIQLDVEGEPAVALIERLMQARLQERATDRKVARGVRVTLTLLVVMIVAAPFGFAMARGNDAMVSSLARQAAYVLVPFMLVLLSEPKGLSWLAALWSRLRGVK
jgi:hypothetical protein